jgi:hypothetical protein
MSGWLPPGVTDADIDNTAPQNEDDLEEAWREHSLAMDEYEIGAAVERMLELGAKAQVMDLLAQLIREHRLDRFVGRLERLEND